MDKRGSFVFDTVVFWVPEADDEEALEGITSFYGTLTHIEAGIGRFIVEKRGRPPVESYVTLRFLMSFVPTDLNEKRTLRVVPRPSDHSSDDPFSKPS